MPLLHWLTRDQDIQTAAKVPHRILQEVPELSYGEPSQNLLVQGDNLEALKALLPFYAGQVKCIYIDPPYNTGSAFEHYDDALEHSKWLAMMLPRVQLLRDLLTEDGTFWVTIDSREGHYLKVLLDEVFGRQQFVAEVIWRSSDNSNNDAKTFSTDHNATFVYAKAQGWLAKKLPTTSDKSQHFKNPDNDPRGPYFDGNPLGSPALRTNLKFDIVAPNGNVIKPPKNGWRWSRETLAEKMSTGEIRFNENFTGIRRRTYLADQKGLPPSTLWIDLEETGHNRQAKFEQKNLYPEKEKEQWFATPKPERLIQRILHIATNPGDLVLDSFLGSGTTAAVAHKMGRRWIGVEMGDHAKTHCATRLHKVIDGEQGGISKDVDWKGGGGFRFCTLGPTIFDEQGRINPEIKFPELARHLWFVETKTPMATATVGTIIGTTEKMAYALLYNGILQDRTPNGGNVLTSGTLKIIREDLEKARPSFEGEVVVYAAASRIGPDRLRDEGIIFKQTPYDISARG